MEMVPNTTRSVTKLESSDLLLNVTYDVDGFVKLSSRETAYCSVFGAGALLLPVLFHVLQLGRWFLPMYLPLFALAFLVRPAPAALTAMVIPWVSAFLTGMPPIYPPVAFWMSVELFVTVGLTSYFAKLRPELRPLPILLGTTVFGRFLYVALVWFTALWMDLPAEFLAVLSLFSGWPGVVLICIVVPPVVNRLRVSSLSADVGD